MVQLSSWWLGGSAVIMVVGWFSCHHGGWVVGSAVIMVAGSAVIIVVGSERLISIRSSYTTVGLAMIECSRILPTT